jgi:large repetitive protein
MTNTQTTTKSGHYFRAMLTMLAMLAAMLVAGGAALAATTTFGNSSPIQIVDDSPANPYPSRINVQNLSGNISDVNVTLGHFSHEFPDDVDVLLVGPKGQKALLMSDVGGGHNVVDTENLNLTFDDEATNPLPDDDFVFPGAYKPTQGTSSSLVGDNPVPANFPSPAPAGPYAANLSVFDGTNPNGTWNLYVMDDSALQSGQLAGGWSLDITTDSPNPQPDTTAPRVTSTVPQPGATGVSPTADLTATFSEDMKASTINATNFKLFKKGSTTKVAATVSYEASADRATLDPTNSLKAGATYKAVVTTVAKDLAGNQLDQSSTLTGLQQKAWTFKVRN